MAIKPFIVANEDELKYIHLFASAAEIEIKYIYLMVKTLKQSGKLKRKRFTPNEFQLVHYFNHRKEVWLLDTTFNNITQDAIITIKQPAWDIKETVFCFCPKEAELQYITKKEFRNNVNWLQQLEILANNDISMTEARFKS